MRGYMFMAHRPPEPLQLALQSEVLARRQIPVYHVAGPHNRGFAAHGTTQPSLGLPSSAASVPTIQSCALRAASRVCWSKSSDSSSP
jgi:hypothetical protein